MITDESSIRIERGSCQKVGMGGWGWRGGDTGHDNRKKSDSFSRAILQMGGKAATTEHDAPHPHSWWDSRRKGGRTR